MITSEDRDLIDLFISNKLSDSESVAFIEKMSSPSFVSEVIFLQKLKGAIGSNNKIVLKNKLNAIHAEMDSVTSKHTTISLLFKYAVAASIFLAIAVGFSFNRGNDTYYSHTGGAGIFQKTSSIEKN